MINSWKNNLLNLPDAVFFDIMRNYLGDLKTPFNKHDLVRSLTTIISKKETRNRIFELIDNDDSRLLTAVALLEASKIDELHEFTKQYYSFLELHNRIANLQERLLICIEYPDQNDHQGRKLITLSPIFEEELKNGYLDTSLVFSSISTASDASAPWLTSQLTAAFLSFTASNKYIFKQSAVSRKKAETQFAGIFSTLSQTDGASPVYFMLKLISTLGFISDDTVNFRFNIKKIMEFGELPPQQQNIILAAAAVSAYKDDPQLFDTAVHSISSLFSSLKPGSRMREDDLKAYIYLVGRSSRKTNPELQELPGSEILDTLTHCGFIIKDDEFRVINFIENIATDDKLRIQSNFEFSAPAGCSFIDEVAAALCCEIRNHDITRTYELTKSSFAAAMDSGLKAEDLAERLQYASTAQIPQNIIFSMTSWEKEYSSITLNYGIVMTVRKERLPLIEHSPGLKDFFTASPAPGVFILDPAREDEWRKAFTDAGFDMLPLTASGQPADIKTEAVKSVPPTTIQRYSRSFTSAADRIIDDLTAKIRKLSMSAENKQKLEARAQKKLILSESQLTASNKPEERGEAGGIDHRAKIRLVERALELDNLLEVTTAKELELEKRLIKPLKLIKSDSGDSAKPPVFLVEGLELPEEIELQIPVTRISYLRMLKSSLFTP